MVDCGATSHIITEKNKFTRFDKSFDPNKHYMELADGFKWNNVALRRGDAEVLLLDKDGRPVTINLRRALFIPTYPQNILSVKAATAEGAKVIFKEGQNILMNRDGVIFPMKEHDRLYYLRTENNCQQCVDDSVNDIMSKDKVNLTCDIKTWHEILGHCNVDDVLKLPNVVEGMKVAGNTKIDCSVCTEGKFTNSRNRKADAKATAPLQLVHTDLAGPIEPTSQEGHKYALSFTDDFTGAVFVYFLKTKCDTTLATEKFLADTAPYSSVKCIRSDNGTEYTSNVFQSLLRDRGIRHETSSPYSPHQNGTAERQWRTLFEMGRCLLLEKGLPKTLWLYAVQTSAHIRNRCYNDRNKNTPFFMLTGKKPDLSKMWVFGSDCYAYKHDQKKLDPKGKKGIFVGYSKNSPAYLVYNPHSRRVSKHRLVKFIRKNSIDQQTQTDEYDTEIQGYKTVKPSDEEKVDGPQRENNTENQLPSEDKKKESTGNADVSQHDKITENTSIVENGNSTDTENRQSQNQSYPKREKKAPKYLEDYITDIQIKDVTHTTVDYCFRADVTRGPWMGTSNEGRD